MEVISIDLSNTLSSNIDNNQYYKSYDKSGKFHMYQNGIATDIYSNKEYVKVVKNPMISDIIINFVYDRVIGQYGTSEQMSAKFEKICSSDFEPLPVSGDFSWVKTSFKDRLWSEINNILKTRYVFDEIKPRNLVHTLRLSSIEDLSSVDVSNIYEIYIPPRINSLPDGFLSNATRLQQIYFGPDKQAHQLTSIGASAFQNAYSLQALNLPNNVKYLYPYAFQNCNQLKKIVLGSAFVDYDEKTVFQAVNKDKCFFVIGKNNIQGFIRKEILSTDVPLKNNILFTANEDEHEWYRRGDHVFMVKNELDDISCQTVTHLEATQSHNIVGWTISILDELLLCLASIIDAICNIITKILESMWKVIVSLWGWITGDDNRQAITDELEKVWTENWNTFFKDYCEKIISELENFLSKFKGAITQVIVEYIDGQQTSIEAIFNGLAIAADSIDEAFNIGSDYYFDEIKKGLRDIADGAKNRLGESIVKGLQQSGDTFFISKNSLETKIGKKIGEEEYKEFIDKCKEYLKNPGKIVGTALNISFNQCIDSVYETIRSTKGVVYNATDHFYLSSEQHLSVYLHEMQECDGQCTYPPHDMHVQCVDKTTKYPNFKWFSDGSFSHDIVTIEGNMFTTIIGSIGGYIVANVFGGVKGKIDTVDKLEQEIIDAADQKYQEYAELIQNCPQNSSQISKINDYYKGLKG